MKLAALALTVLGLATNPSPPHFDLLIQGGRVIDGAGNPAFFADIAISKGKIVKIGRQLGSADEILDAKGMVVAPGFIDVHTHAENVVELPDAENYIRMGVTSIV